jgi:hypothetical protein
MPTPKTATAPGVRSDGLDVLAADGRLDVEFTGFGVGSDVFAGGRSEIEVLSAGAGIATVAAEDITRDVEDVARDIEDGMFRDAGRGCGRDRLGDGVGLAIKDGDGDGVGLGIMNEVRVVGVNKSLDCQTSWTRGALRLNVEIDEMGTCWSNASLLLLEQSPARKEPVVAKLRHVWSG